MKHQINENTFIVGRQAIVFNTKLDPANSSPITKMGNEVADDICKWGDDNLYPQNFYKKLKKVGTALGGLDILTAAHFGTGFQLIEEDDTTGTIQFKERTLSSFPEIKDFVNRSRFNLFSSEIIEDYETFRIAFPEYLLTPNFDQVKSIKRLSAANCRFEAPINGKIQNVIYNSDWEKREKEYDLKIPIFDPYIPIEEIKAHCKKNKIGKFIIPVVDTLTIEKIYPLVSWHSSFQNGWVDVILSIPEFKKYQFENQLNVKYLIHISDEYFKKKLGDDIWASMTKEEKMKMQNELIDSIDDKMSGNANSGGSLISPFFIKDGKEVKGIQIEKIGNEGTDGEYLLDASIGNLEITISQGVDISLLGGGIPGAKNLSGSGSDKREAWTILCARTNVKQIRTLQIFENIKLWNGWPDNIYGKYPNVNLTTLDNNPSGQTKIIT